MAQSTKHKFVDKFVLLFLLSINCKYAAQKRQKRVNISYQIVNFGFMHNYGNIHK